MASSYFTLPSFTRAKKNTEELEKTNPKQPVLNDEDEKFLQRQMSTDQASKAVKDQPTTAITDEGEEKAANTEQQVDGGADQTVVPDTQPGAEEGKDATKEQLVNETAEQAVGSDTQPGAEEEKSANEEQQVDGSTDNTDAPDTQPSTNEEPTQEAEGKGDGYDDAQKEKAAAAVQARKDKKKKSSMDLPSQEEAEAATKGYHEQSGAQQSSEKRTWASYLPNVRPSSRKTDDKATSATPPPPPSDLSDQKTWAQYASSYVPSLSSLPNLRKSRDVDSTPEPVYKEDGTIDEEATKAKQEREVSVLLDHLNLSSINNRVFAFSPATQDIYQRFALVLRDMINGAPTAYDDMEKLMRDAGPTLQKQFNSMPPFVQTLVKSLPMKVGPELMAAAGEKPDDELRRKMKAASAPGASASASTAAAGLGQVDKTETDEEKKKQKRRIPGLKSLTASEGAIATMLRNTVTFVQTRFPFLASTTNVVMSLSVFILMFVFWYCHKRGKEVRLAREEAEGKEGAGEVVGEEEDEYEVSDEAEEDEDEDANEESQDQSVEEKSNILNQPEPTEVPLPEKDEGEKTSTT